MPTFGGTDIFGTAVSMSTTEAGETQVSGMLWSTALDGLHEAEEKFREMVGETRGLIDTLGIPWLSVRLDSFQPQGRVRQSPGGTFFRAYKAWFVHLQSEPT